MAAADAESADDAVDEDQTPDAEAEPIGGVTRSKTSLGVSV